MQKSTLSTIFISACTTLIVLAVMAFTNVQPTNQAASPEAMSVEPFIGEVTMFGGNFAPRGWAFCEGQLLPIGEYQALFSILGTTYGGDGRTTFGLPDMRGRAAIGSGNGPGLSNYRQGQKGGAESVTLTQNNLPTVQIPFPAADETANTESPKGAMFANMRYFEGNTSNIVNMKPLYLQGNNQPVGNMQPFIAVRYIIALQGVYPSRN